MTAVYCSHMVRERQLVSRDVRSGSEFPLGFDFLHGAWTVRHRKLCERLADCNEWFEFVGTLDVRPILEGRGNFDRNVLEDPSGAYEAHSLRLCAPGSGIWSIWWLDERHTGAGLGPPVIGGFDGSKGTFLGKDVFEGQPIEVRTTYEPLSETSARWTQAFRPGAHRDWEVNWVMDFSRASS